MEEIESVLAGIGIFVIGAVLLVIAMMAVVALMVWINGAGRKFSEAKLASKEWFYFKAWEHYGKKSFTDGMAIKAAIDALDKDTDWRYSVEELRRALAEYDKRNEPMTDEEFKQITADYS